MEPSEPKETTPCISLALYDKKHWLKCTSLQIPFHASDLKMSVTEFMFKVQKAHRRGGCSICPGPIFVKSAWLVRIPSAHATTVLLPDCLEHNPGANVQFMEPIRPISDYFGIDFSYDVGVISVLLESTFDVKSPPNESPSKRALEITEDTSQAAGSGKRLKVEAPGPLPLLKGIHTIPPTDPSSPLNLPPPSFTYSSLIDSLGVVFVDKSSFIPALDFLLTLWPCIVILPPGVGKSTILRMLLAWYDSTMSPEMHDQLFVPLEIGPQVHAARSKPGGKSPYSAREHLCLVFELREVEWKTSTGGKGLARSIESYCCGILREFVDKHDLGNNELFPWDNASSELMIGELKESLVARQKQDRAAAPTLFIGVDHFDAPILRYLEAAATVGPLQDFESLVLVAESLNALLTNLKQLARSRDMLKMSKLLINSNLLRFPGMNLDHIQNISLRSEVQGAFGVTPKEVSHLFSVLSHNRTVDLSLDLKKPGISEHLGAFSPPPLSPEDAPPRNICSFTIVLHHAAQALNLKSEHSTLEVSGPISAISAACKSMLIDSNLRRKHPVFIAPVAEIRPSRLLMLYDNEEMLWTCLFCLGVLKVTDQGPPDSRPLWALQLSNSFAERQLFSGLPPISRDKFRESTRDRLLRSLLERSPAPFTNAITKRLETRHSRDLFEMSEAVFQAVIDEFVGNCEDGISPLKDNYFAQLGLLTDITKKKGDYSKSEHAHLPGEGRYGYADLYFRGPLSLRRYGRVILVELKYLSLFGFIRADYASVEEDKYIAAVHENINCSLEEHCKKKAKFLRSLSLEKLRAQQYWRYEKGKLTKYTVGEILKAAEQQLGNYLNALVNGKTTVNEATTGITRAERRVDVKSGKDDVVGMIFCGVGADIVTICMDTRQTRYEYMGRAAKSVYD
ncbi:hypothetical protein B0H11DRAFT_800 [Mycena galericulata]|nr:hypothetical protein B0H11DRAFT_800 [Mycena galericulata]